MGLGLPFSICKFLTEISQCCHCISHLTKNMQKSKKNVSISNHGVEQAQVLKHFSAGYMHAVVGFFPCFKCGFGGADYPRVYIYLEQL